MWRIFLLCLPITAQACERPICEVGANAIYFARTVTFDEQASSLGPGRAVPDVISMQDVAFGERFAGQTTRGEGTFDRVNGNPTAPLTIVAGEQLQNLTIIRLADTNVLSGNGPEGYPKHSATGEGAISVLFSGDQPSLGFDLRGGESGYATVTFLNRDGTVIDTHLIGPLAEQNYTFRRIENQADIAGIVITNDDPDGIALDTLAFEASDQNS